MCGMLQNSLKKAKEAKKKEANLGEDIDIEEFKIEEPGEHESVESLEEIPKKYQNTLLQVGVDPKSEERGGSFMMMGQSEIIAQSNTESIELLNIRDALEKYDWLSDYCGTPITLTPINTLLKLHWAILEDFLSEQNQEQKQYSPFRHVCLLEMKD